MPASQKQIEANRLNAQKSTGPQTPGGKESSRTNATTHGLTAAATIYKPIRHENPADFQEVRAALLLDCKPVGAREQLAVEMIAAAYKRIQRCEAFEAAYFDGGMESIERRHGKRAKPSSADDLGCGIVMGKPEHKLTWENLDRYRRNAWLDYNRATEQLRRHQKDRKNEEAAAARRETTQPATPRPEPKSASFLPTSPEPQNTPQQPLTPPTFHPEKELKAA